MLTFLVWLPDTKRMLQMPGDSIKGLAFKIMLLPEDRTNDVENRLVLFQIYLIMFSKFTWLWSAMPVRRMVDFLQKALLKTCKYEWKRQARFRLVSFLAIMTYGCVHVLCARGRMESPWINHSHLWGETFLFPHEENTCQSMLKSSLWSKQVMETCSQF